MITKEQLEQAAAKAKEIILELNQSNEELVQWNYQSIEDTIKRTYQALKNFTDKKIEINQLEQFLSERALNKLEESNLSLRFFDEKYNFEDFLIVSAFNLPGTESDCFEVWMDFDTTFLNTQKEKDII